VTATDVAGLADVLSATSPYGIVVILGYALKRMHEANTALLKEQQAALMSIALESKDALNKAGSALERFLATRSRS